MLYSIALYAALMVRSNAASCIQDFWTLSSIPARPITPAGQTQYGVSSALTESETSVITPVDTIIPGIERLTSRKQSLSPSFPSTKCQIRNCSKRACPLPFSPWNRSYPHSYESEGYQRCGGSSHLQLYATIPRTLQWTWFFIRGRNTTHRPYTCSTESIAACQHTSPRYTIHLSRPCKRE